MSIFKKLKHIAISLLGFAFIGGLSIACLTEKAKAESVHAEGEIEYAQGEFYIYENGERISLIFHRFYYYGDVSYEHGVATVYLQDNDGNQKGAVQLTNVRLFDIPESGTSYNGYLDATYESPSGTIEISDYHVQPAAPIWFNGEDGYVIDPSQIEDSYWDYNGTLMRFEYYDQVLEKTYCCQFVPAPDGEQIICEYQEMSGNLTILTSVFRVDETSGEAIQTKMTKLFNLTLDHDPEENDEVYKCYFNFKDNIELAEIPSMYMTVTEGSTSPYQPGWNYDPTNHKLMHQDSDMMCDPELTQPNTLKIIDDNLASIDYVNMGNHDYDPGLVYFYDYNYDDENHLLTGRLDGLSVYDLETKEYTDSVTVSTTNLTPIYSVKNLIIPENIELYVGQTYQVDIEVVPANADATIEWHSENEEVARVNGGTISAVGTGEVIIYAYDQMTEIQSNGCIVTVTEPQYEGLVYDGDNNGFIYRSLGDETYNIELQSLTFFDNNEGSFNACATYALISTSSGSTGRTVEAFIEPAQLSEVESPTTGDTQYEIVGSWTNALEVSCEVDLIFNRKPEIIYKGFNYSAKSGSFFCAESSRPSDCWAAIETSATYYNDDQTVILTFEGLDDTITLTGCEFTFEDSYIVYGTWAGLDDRIAVILSHIDYIDGVSKISFNANGGTGTMNPSVIPNGVEMQFGCVFEKQGYVFDGWAVDSADSERVIGINDTLLVNQNYTLYALWKSSSAYTYVVTFDGNGATDGSMQPLELSGDSYSQSFVFPSCGYTKEGYSFIGWGTTTESLIRWKPNEEYNSVTSDMTFYAQWGKTYTISFYANGGTGTMPSITVVQGNNTVPGCDFVREGYTFVCWAVGSADSSTTVNAGDKVNVSMNYSLYAIWEKGGDTPKVADYRISFNGNGATDGRMAPMSCNAGDNIVPECAFVRDGYVFAGWAVDSPDSRVIVQPGEKVNVNKDYTLYATWVKRTIEWRYIDEQLCWYDSAYPEDWAEPYSAVLYESDSGQEDIIFLTYVILRYEALDEPITSDAGPEEEASPIVVREVRVALRNAVAQEDGEWVNISGIYEDLEDANVNVSIEKVNFSIGETEGRNLSPMQEAEIRDNIPVDQNAKVEDALDNIPQATVNEIIGVIGSTNSAIESDTSLTPEQVEAAYESVKKAVEASVVVGAQQTTANAEGAIVNDALPEGTGINMSDTLTDFYEKQMDILLGKSDAPPKRMHRGGNEEENTIDYSIPADDYGKMISFVDTSVENMKNATLQIRDCSGVDIINEVNEYIEMIVGSSFRNYDKEAADMAYVEQAHESIMLALQKQVIEALTKDHKPSNDPEKEAQYNEQLEAVKDIDTFKEMVMEVLRLKYVSLTEKEIDIDSFRDIYWNIFKAWALDEPEFNEYGITLEELTNATIETATAKANPIIFRDKLASEEIIFISVAGGVVVLGVGGAIAVPTILKKKRGLAK